MEHTPQINNPIDIGSIVEQYADDLFRWAYHRTSVRETAEDLVQETFIAALKASHKFENQSNLKTWLFSILNNKIMDHYRRQYREMTFNQSTLTEDAESRNLLEHLFDNHGNWNDGVRKYDSMNVDEHLLDDNEFRAVLQGCINHLPDKWSTVIQMKYLFEKKTEDICQELGITPSNYWQLLHRSKLQLRECLKKKWYDEIN